MLSQQVERRLRGLVDDGRAVFLGEGEHAEDSANARRAVVLMDRVADGSDLRAGVSSASE